MEKTPLGTNFKKQLSEVNNQACYFAFQTCEFHNLVEEGLKKPNNKYIGEVFPSNVYSARINIPINKLREYGQVQNATGLHMGVITAFEYAKIYMKEIQAFRKKIETTDIDQLFCNTEEETLLKKLREWSQKDVQKEYFDTIEYIRHRRNHFAHSWDTPVEASRKFIKDNGHRLGQFWTHDFTELFHYDFKSQNLNNISTEHTFALLNILRASVYNIDSLVSQTLPLDKIVAYKTNEILAQKPNVWNNKARLISKLRESLMMEYGKKVSLKKLSELV